ncbi:MAG: hypothetical protein LBO69_00735 [Ignavibacteria bacterium]|jgi:hypothetical protein|nr:hypothetical protein [Ignavibacteria bacterium]
MAKNNQITGNIGLFYVCYQLSKRGWNVLPTSRNTTGIDIVIHNTKGTKVKFIQVKTLSGRNDVPLGKGIMDKITDDMIWLIITNVREDSPEIHIMSGEAVKKLAGHDRENPEKPNQEPSYWLNPRDYGKFLNNWELIGTPDDNLSDVCDD